MKLSEKEQKIVSAVQLRAREPIAAVSKEAGCEEHVARYTLQRLQKKGVIKRGCFVNLCRLGYTQYQIYFSFSSDDDGAHQRILGVLQDSGGISWVGEIGGDYHFGLNLCVRNVVEVSEFLSDLSRRGRFTFINKAVAARLSLQFFGAKYLSGSSKSSPLSYQATREIVEIDDLDQKVLAALVNDEWKSVRDLSRQLGVASSTLDDHVKRLERSGIVVGYYYYLEPSANEMQSFLLLISVKGFEPKQRTALLRFAQNHPRVVVFIEAIGNWDFEMTMDVEQARDTISIVQELHSTFSNYIQSIQVLPIFGYPKVREYPFESK
jgi:DNA-binding Lrp family transcriptional regulator